MSITHHPNIPHVIQGVKISEKAAGAGEEEWGGDDGTGHQHVIEHTGHILITQVITRLSIGYQYIDNLLIT